MAGAGLPGTGIGGLFYLIMALLSPIRHGWRVITRRSTAGSGRDITHTLLLALGIAAGLWVTGIVLGRLVPVGALHLPTAASPAAQDGTAVPHHNALRVAAFVAASGTLLAVLLATELARLLVGRRAGRTRDLNVR